MAIYTSRFNINVNSFKLIKNMTGRHSLSSRIFYQPVPVRGFRQKTYDETLIHVSPHSNMVLPQVPLPAFFWKKTEPFAQSKAMKCVGSGKTYTFEDIKGLAISFARGLKDVGFRYGDVLAIMTNNSPEYLALCLGAQILGGSVTLVSGVFQPEEAVYQIAHAEAKVLVTNSDRYKLMKSEIQKNSTVKKVITVDKQIEDSVLLQDFIQKDGTEVYFINVDPREDLAFIPYTGMSKGVMLTHYNIVSNILQATKPGVSSITLHSSDGAKQETIFSVLPFCHIYGLTVSFMSLILGKKFVTLDTFDTKRFVEVIQNEKPDHLYIVPTLGQLMVENPKISKEVMSSVKTVYCGGAPLATSLYKKIVGKFDHIKLYQGYGLTETSPVVTLSYLKKPMRYSIGQLIPNTKAKVVDLLTGKSLGPNQEGELHVQGPQVMKGYLKNREETKNVIQRDHWLRTGDIVKYDEDGNFFIMDRFKSLIKVKGHAVFPAEVENVLKKHPKIKDVGVVGVADAFFGEIPMALVVRKDASLTEEEVQKHVTKLAEHKHLKGGVRFVDTIPREPNGKLLRHELKKLAEHHT